MHLTENYHFQRHEMTKTVTGQEIPCIKSPAHVLFATLCAIFLQLTLFFSVTASSTPPLPPLLTPSAMNMDRFERGPREILNPEIQKVRLTPALNETWCRSVSRQA